MTEAIVPILLFAQTALAVIGLISLPWRGRPLDEATHSVQRINRRFRRLAERISQDGPPASARSLPRAPTFLSPWSPAPR